MQPTLILVHGAVLNGGMWAPIAADLSRDYNVLTPDLPGHGSRAGEKFTLAAAVATLTDIAKQLAPAPIVLAGDSLGGYTSLAAAASLGDQLKGAVLGGCTMNFRGPPDAGRTRRRSPLRRFSSPRRSGALRDSHPAGFSAGGHRDSVPGASPSLPTRTQ
jgi:pimeloyl-ACP methyl ester carboxylesterase